MIVKWYLNLLKVWCIVILCVDFNALTLPIGSEESAIGKNGKVYYSYPQNTSAPIHSPVQSAHTPKQCEINPVLNQWPLGSITLPIHKRIPPQPHLRYQLTTVYLIWLLLPALIILQQVGNIITQLPETQKPCNTQVSILQRQTSIWTEQRSWNKAI